MDESLPLRLEVQFNEQTRRFPMDPAIATYRHVYVVVKEAFQLAGNFRLTFQRGEQATQSDPVMMSLTSDWDFDAALQSVDTAVSLKEDPVLRLRVIDDREHVQEDKEEIAPEVEGVPCSTHKEGVSIHKDVGSVSRSLKSLPSVTPLATWGGRKSSSSISGKSLGDDWMIVEERPSAAACNNITNAKPEFLPTRIMKATLGKIVHTVREISRRRPLSRSDWMSYLDSKDPQLRPIIWRHLLGVFPPEISARKRARYVHKLHRNYSKLKESWQSKDQTELKQLSDMIMKDVRRTDRKHPYFSVDDGHSRLQKLFNVLMTYATNNPDVMYAQGMSDIASLFVVLYELEADSFVCFSQLMKRMKHHFLLESVAVTQKFSSLQILLKHVDPFYYNYLQQWDADDLLFCYRWLLLDMKREFEFNDALKVLEITWSVIPKVPGPGDEPYEPEFTTMDDITNDGTGNESPSGTGDHLFDMENEDGWQQPQDNEEEEEMKAVVEELNSIIPSDIISKEQHPPDEDDTCDDNSALLTSSSDQLSDSQCITTTAQTGSPTTTADDDKADHLADLSCALQTSSEISKQFDSFETLDSAVMIPSICGAGNPFTMFGCLTLLLVHKDHIMMNNLDYNELAMHYDMMARKTNFGDFITKTRSLFIKYLKSCRDTEEFTTFTAICNDEVAL
ncbi:TBC1 domain family member 25-like isoform X2 [Corticium candelabrum]|uniref:TBC1 domain family member 25-like isoform X2 n=1 Tax=Corticium candelabrum TaxID=121492 RepID=UPI002E2742ED|nr:TBC1 domain family member 25-like isoform X2 [Corticium candelabrum]